MLRRAAAAAAMRSTVAARVSLPRAPLRTGGVRHTGNKVMGADYRALGIKYYEPVFVSVSTQEGLQELMKTVSHKKCVVICYHKLGDSDLKKALANIAVELPLAEFNDKILWAFASHTLDPTLPCYPVVDIHAKGELYLRSLGRSPVTVRGGICRVMSEVAFPSDPDADEEWPSLSTLYGVDKPLYSKILWNVMKASPQDLMQAVKDARNDAGLDE
eukprot:Rhum_TRINITY_DN23007_c0_g1::Rhum_TRINITY_DN23007_c0_g1_i1::g.176823::m.176823